MLKLKAFLLSVMVGALAAGVASAGTKTLIIDNGDLLASGTSGEVLDGFGVAMDDVADSQLAFAFTLPNNYKKNSPVIIRLQMMSSGTSCNMAFGPTIAVRQHKASGIAITDGLVSVPAGLTTVAMPAITTKLVTRDFKLKKPTSTLPPGFSGQKAGDLITVLFERDPVLPADTCADSLVIRSAKVIYKTP